MKNFFITIIFIFISSINIFSQDNFSEVDLLGKWYYISDFQNFNFVSSHDFDQYIEIKKSNDGYIIRFTLGLNHDYFEAHIAEFIKTTDGFTATYNYEYNKSRYDRTLIFEPEFEELRNIPYLTFYEPGAIDINGRYINKNDIIEKYISIQSKPNLQIFGYVNTSSLRLRTSPSKTGSITSSLPQNTKIVLVNRSEKKEFIDGYNDYWLRVTVIGNDKTGWLYGAYIDLEQDFVK